MRERACASLLNDDRSLHILVTDAAGYRTEERVRPRGIRRDRDIHGLPRCDLRIDLEAGNRKAVIAGDALEPNRHLFSFFDTDDRR